jgi:hypothetical protein
MPVSIKKFKETLSTPLYKNPEATFNKPKKVKSPKAMSPVRSVSPKAMSPVRSVSPKVMSPRSPVRSVSPKAMSPKTMSPKTMSPRSLSPKSPRSYNINLPGVSSAKSFDTRYAAMRPSIERFETNEIIRKNPKVSMQELSEILGVTRVNLPAINTKIDKIELSPVNVERAKSPSRVTSKKASSGGCDIKIGGKHIDKAMISEKKSGNKNIYNVKELREIGKQLNLSLSNLSKDLIVSAILKELEARGC